MKKKTVMSFCKVILSLATILCSYSSLQAQSKPDFFTQNIYFVSGVYMKYFEDQFFVLMKSSPSYLDTAEARVQLKEKIHTKALIANVPKLKKKLESRELANHVRECTVVFGSFFDCGNCNR